MKVYMRYWKERCTNPSSDYYGKGCGYICDYDNIATECDGFRRKDPDENSLGWEDCYYRQGSDRVIAKEIKSIEIDKNDHYPYGTVKINRTTYDLDDVSLLKVDYGEGWVNEFSQGDNDNE